MCVGGWGVGLKPEPERGGFLRPPTGLADVSVVCHKTMFD